MPKTSGKVQKLRDLENLLQSALLQTPCSVVINCYSVTKDCVLSIVSLCLNVEIDVLYFPFYFKCRALWSV